MLLLILAVISAFWLAACSDIVNLHTRTSSPPASTGSPPPPPGSSETQIIYLTWDNPVRNADGSPLNPATLMGYTVTYSVNGEAPVTDKVRAADGANTWQSPPLKPGTYTFSVSVFGSTGKSVESREITVDL